MDANLPFVKMHGAGNDFVVLDARTNAIPLTASQAAIIADRRRGIGCDQIILIEPSPTADAFMRILNADGSESGACGNATRCVAALLAEETGARALTIQTNAGLLAAIIKGPNLVEIDMGEPQLAWQDIPLLEPMDTLNLRLALGPVENPAACSMGNPHATFFIDDFTHLALDSLGPRLENARIFPARANIGFARIDTPDRIRLRVWERGAGLTLACGSGACAALVNAHRRGLASRSAAVEMDGGTLIITWRDDNHVLMEGPVALTYAGIITPELLPA
jgi:diaminopimelate epimerase